MLAWFLQASALATVSDRLPTRWEGDRCLDWFAATARVGLTSRSRAMARFSDHVPIRASFSQAPSVPEPQEWREALATAGNASLVRANKAQHRALQQPTVQVDREWNLFRV